MTETGLMAFWADIDADYVLPYQQWHNCEHIPERVTSPGFRRGCRYRAMDDRPHFLMFYETDTPAALASDYYLTALNNPTPWTKEALTHFRNPVRNIYRLQATAGHEGPFAAPWLASLRFNAANPPAPAWLEAAAAIEAVERVRLYAVDEEISGIMTSERKIYGGGPGQQRFLVLIEAADPAAGAQALSAADAAQPHTRADEFVGDYWLEMSHRKRLGEAEP